jgi:hypothetical protein
MEMHHRCSWVISAMCKKILAKKTQKGHKDDGDDVKQTGMFKKYQN